MAGKAKISTSGPVIHAGGGTTDTSAANLTSENKTPAKKQEKGKPIEILSKLLRELKKEITDDNRRKEVLDGIESSLNNLMHCSRIKIRKTGEAEAIVYLTEERGWNKEVKIVGRNRNNNTKVSDVLYAAGMKKHQVIVAADGLRRKK